MGDACRVDEFEDGSGEHRDQGADLVCGAVGLGSGEQPHSAIFKPVHPAVDDGLEQTRAGVEVIVHGGVVALARGRGDIAERDIHAAFGDESFTRVQ